MSNYSYPYITEHFKKVTPNHSNCKNALDFHKLAAYGAFDISNNFNGNPNELKNIFWRNIGRLCNYNDGKADCLLTDNRDSDNYKIKGGEQCSKVKNDYNNALSNLYQQYFTGYASDGDRYFLYQSRLEMEHQ